MTTRGGCWAASASCIVACAHGLPSRPPPSPGLNRRLSPDDTDTLAPSAREIHAVALERARSERERVTAIIADRRSIEVHLTDAAPRCFMTASEAAAVKCRDFPCIEREFLSRAAATLSECCSSVDRERVADVLRYFGERGGVRTVLLYGKSARSSVAALWALYCVKSAAPNPPQDLPSPTFVERSNLSESGFVFVFEGSQASGTFPDL